MVKTLPLTSCPACGGDHFDRFDLGRGNLLQRCRTCAAVSALEYADPDEVFKPGYLFGEAGSFGMDVRHPVFQEYLAQVANRRLGMIESATKLRRAKLLDVGCGTGEVLKAAADRGWTVEGVEPEATAAEMAQERGLDVRVSLLEESGIPEGTFDVVCAFHVLEHMADSREFLDTLKRWVRPGGFIVIEVPNFASVQRRRRGSRWMHLRPLEHLVHFTPDSLTRTLRSADLEPAELRTPHYLSPPQTLDHALAGLAREGWFRRLVTPFSHTESRNGADVRYPTRLGWAVLQLAAFAHDRAGVGAVVFCVARTG